MVLSASLMRGRRDPLDPKRLFFLNINRATESSKPSYIVMDCKFFSKMNIIPLCHVRHRCGTGDERIILSYLLL